jgi:hypothetical protein
MSILIAPAEPSVISEGVANWKRLVDVTDAPERHTCRRPVQPVMLGATPLSVNVS